MIPTELSKSVLQLPSVWDRYWFSAVPTGGVSVLRVGLASVALIHFASFLVWVPQWLSGTGWFDLETARYVIGDGLAGTGSQYRWSVLYRAIEPWAGTVLCVVGAMSSIAACLGVGTRLALLIAWICLLMIHHRAPWLTMPGEFLLIAGLFYCIIDPGRVAWTLQPGWDDRVERTGANLALRCCQVHLIIWLLFSVTSMLQYSVWWNGSAVPLLSRQISSIFGPLADSSYFGQACTLALLGLQFGAAFFLVHPRIVALGLICLALFAGAVALLAGDWLYASVLIAMGMSFLPSHSFISTTDGNDIP